VAPLYGAHLLPICFVMKTEHETRLMRAINLAQISGFSHLAGALAKLLGRPAAPTEAPTCARCHGKPATMLSAGRRVCLECAYEEAT
jgi:cytochrome c553